MSAQPGNNRSFSECSHVPPVHTLHPRKDAAPAPDVPADALPKPRRGRPPKAKAQPDTACSKASEPTREPLAVRVEVAAELIGCGISKMKEMVSDGTVKSTKLGAMRLVHYSSLKRLLGDD
jgi:hypothetical protein